MITKLFIDDISFRFIFLEMTELFCDFSKESCIVAEIVTYNAKNIMCSDFGLLILIVTKFFPLLFANISYLKNNSYTRIILSYIKENPGCLEAEIVKNLNIKRSTLRYYLFKRTSNLYITKINKGRIKGLFHITCSLSEKQKLLCLHKKNKTRSLIIHIISHSSGISISEISSCLNIDKSTVHWHVKALYTDELIKFEMEGRSKKYYLLPFLIEH